MTPGDLQVFAVIALMVIGAIVVLVRNRLRGKNSCGCNCPGCPGKKSMVVITDISNPCDCCKKH